MQIMNAENGNTDIGMRLIPRS